MCWGGGKPYIYVGFEFDSWWWFGRRYLPLGDTAFVSMRIYYVDLLFNIEYSKERLSLVLPLPSPHVAIT